ncbi:peptide ABC transporter substrate-binding protein [Oceanirhabdus sp. W0125-5]|uniref:peptide ABC transporter substrate-binding protein n=1 Tax=Oceanirhabdus sp. W0125-5 TaxID=2999116 RepID=UPI0022F2F07C|nr:peptide ABC transporter substrate-binding protein [Oceanirhabdus sp. W0125-5]WBW99390.1 peptide ABC transporter substrate-binding protein [Oceanirhabdus sp. W0125-5]
MKSKKMIAALMALTVGTGAVLTACGDKAANKGNDNTSKSNAEGNNGIDEEQYLNIFLGAEPKTIDPSRSSDLYSNQILTHIVDGLTRIEQDENGDKIVPGIAESWEVSEDGLVWTFNLRDAKWSDGVAVTAKDFEYGVKRTLDPNTGSNYAWLITPVIKNADAFNKGEATADEVGVKALDEKTVQFTLESPVAYFLDLTYFRVMLPQRQDIVEQYGEAYGSEAEQMLSNGAFTLESWTHDSELVFKKNPDYWNADVVKLDTVAMKIVKDESARMNTLFTGQVDLGVVSKAEWMNKFNEMGEFTYSSVAKPSAVYEVFNQNSRYFKNDKIRKAFITAIDREAINQTLYRGIYMPAYAWVPYAVQIGGEEFRDKSSDLPIKRLIEETPDPKALLIEGLKELGESENPADMTVTMLQSGTNSRSREFAEFEQQKLQEVLGINVKIDYYEWAVFSDLIRKGEYDFASQGWSGDYNDPMTFLEMFASTADVVPSGWVNEEYDSLIKESTMTTDQQKRFEMFKRAEEILLYEDAVISPWIFRKTSTYTRKYAKGVMTPLFGTTDVTKAYTVNRDK